ncbi:MAG: sigma 54-interacting transcriptional regulator [Firmicutes bacterium]|nr:sigma 54-interacting transcriptional regulator [Bacillota bacterium]
MDRHFFDNNPVMRDIFNNMSDAVYFVDNRGTLLFVNHAGEKLDGYTLEEIKGKTVMEAYSLKPSESPLLRVVCNHEPLRENFFRYYINDREVYQVCNTFPVQLEDGFWGAISIQKDMTSLKRTIDRNIELQQQLFGMEEGSSSSGKYYTFDSIIGDHELLQKCKQMAYNAGQGDASVMLTGMTGTGKELFAQSIHSVSRRAKKPFLAINCAAIPETLIEGLLFGTVKGAYTGAIDRKGLFVEADGGTLFLDEVNSMPLSSQAKLLRALEERRVQPLGSKEEIPFDTRIISSCNASPQEVFHKKLIREDLFYRLAVVNIEIPPLKERKSDIFLLVHHFISQYNEAYGKNVLHIEDDITKFFLDYEWPGNVRQLKNCIDGAMNMVSKNEISIKRHHLPFYLLQEDTMETESSFLQNDLLMNHAPSFSEKSESAKVKEDSPLPKKAKKESGIMAGIREAERDAIIEALTAAGGNVSKAARAMGLTRQTLVYRMKKHNID